MRLSRKWSEKWSNFDQILDPQGIFRVYWRLFAKIVFLPLLGPLFIWEEFSRKGPPYPPAPQVCLPIASLLVNEISSNLAHIYLVALGKFSEFGAMTFQPIP